MKKIFVLMLGLNFCFAYSQIDDPIVMTVGDMEVPLSEFLFLAQKDGSVNLLNKKSRNNYVELVKNFKLKVADAKSLRIQESLLFQQELASHQAQLIEGYLSDKEGETQAIRQVYERGKEILSLSHIMFKLPEKSLPKDTLEVFNKANEVYKRILAGEDFETVGKALDADENSEAIFEDADYVFPLQAFRELEEAAYALHEGGISAPVRTLLGFHIIRLNRKYADTNRIQVAHILIQSPESDDPEDDQALLARANEVYGKMKNGEDFGKLAVEYSADEQTRENGGVLPFFGLGAMVLPFEQAAFALENIGDVTEPVQTRYGYHIIKLVGKRDYPTFEELEYAIYMAMSQGEWKHELYKVFDERQKEKLGYTFYQEAYNELLRLSDDYFPTDDEFYSRANQLDKPLMRMNEQDFPQYEFVDYMRVKPISLKTYSGDFLHEQYQLFVREIITKLIQLNLEEGYPEFSQLMNECHDGILLFEVSNTRIWEKPLEDQARLEQEWMKELNQKYKVVINRKVLNNIKKYLK